MELRTFVRGLLIAIVIACAGPIAAKDPLPGLFIKLGEAYIFRVENGQPVDIRKAGDAEEPQDGELKASMENSMGTLLVVTNKTAEFLNYEAYVSKSPDAKGKRTSVCTLIAGGSGFESWPERLPGIRLTNFVPAGGSMGCR